MLLVEKWEWMKLSEIQVTKLKISDEQTARALTFLDLPSSRLHMLATIQGELLHFWQI